MRTNYLKLLPIHGKEFRTDEGVWRAKVTNTPDDPPFQDSDLVCYMLEFTGPSIRHLNLYVPKPLLKPNLNPFPAEIIEVIGKWLEGDEQDGKYRISAEDVALWAWKKTYANRHRRLA